MSPLYLEHVSDFFLLLEKAEVLSEASKALATHHACLLPFSFPFSVFWLPDHLLHSLIPGLLHIVGLVIWNLYSFFIPQCDGHFWGRPSLNPPPAAPDLVRLFHTTVYLSLEAFLQLWLYSYSCDWLADVGLPTGCMSRRSGAMSALLCSWTLRVWCRIWLLLTIDEYLSNEWTSLDWGLLTSGHCSLNTFIPWDLSMFLSGRCCMNVKTWSFKPKDCRLSHYRLTRETLDRSQYFPNLKPREISLSAYFVIRNLFSDWKKAGLCFVYYWKEQG